ncbi:RNA polymerase II associated protein 1 [Balamuthia mandrillaris]
MSGQHHPSKREALRNQTTEEDLIRYQQQFLRSGERAAATVKRINPSPPSSSSASSSSASQRAEEVVVEKDVVSLGELPVLPPSLSPAAHPMSARRGRGSSASRFAQQRRGRREAEPVAETDAEVMQRLEEQDAKDDLFTVLTNIVERDASTFSFAPPSSLLSSPRTGFPEVLHRSAFRQQQPKYRSTAVMTKKNVATVKETNRISSSSFVTSRNEGGMMEEIRKETATTLSTMSAEEIEQAQEEIARSLDPALVALLKKRGQNRNTSSSCSCSSSSSSSSSSFSRNLGKAENEQKGKAESMNVVIEEVSEEEAEQEKGKDVVGSMELQRASLEEAPEVERDLDVKAPSPDVVELIPLGRKRSSSQEEQTTKTAKNHRPFKASRISEQLQQEARQKWPSKKEIEQRIKQELLTKPTTISPLPEREPEKEEWIGNIDDKTSSLSSFSSSAPTFGVACWRFDFGGNVLWRPEMSEEEEMRRKQDVPTHAALHHHGKEPEKAGYTIEELVLLSRSQVASQRVIALNTLAEILRQRRSTQTNEDSASRMLLQRFVLHEMNPRMALLLRMALDDKTTNVLASAVRALHALLCDPLEERILDQFCEWYGGLETFPLAPNPYDTTYESNDGHSSSTTLDLSFDIKEEVNVDLEKDADLAEKDVIHAVLRMRLLSRLRYILEVVRIPTVVPLILEILIRIARHSVAAARAVFQCPRLIEVLRKEFIEVSPFASQEEQSEGNDVYYGTPLPSAIKLVRVLCQADRTVAFTLSRDGLIDCTKRFIVISTSNQKEEEETTNARDVHQLLFIESIRLWNVCVTYGLNTGLYVDIFPILFEHMQPFSFFHSSSASSASSSASPSTAQKTIISAQHCQRTQTLFNFFASLTNVAAEPARFTSPKLSVTWTNVVPLLDHSQVLLFHLNTLICDSLSASGEDDSRRKEEDDLMLPQIALLGSVLHLLAVHFEHVSRQEFNHGDQRTPSPSPQHDSSSSMYQRQHRHKKKRGMITTMERWMMEHILPLVHGPLFPFLLQLCRSKQQNYSINEKTKEEQQKERLHFSLDALPETFLPNDDNNALRSFLLAGNACNAVLAFSKLFCHILEICHALGRSPSSRQTNERKNEKEDKDEDWLRRCVSEVLPSLNSLLTSLPQNPQMNFCAEKADGGILGYSHRNWFYGFTMRIQQSLVLHLLQLLQLADTRFDYSSDNITTEREQDKNNQKANERKQLFSCAFNSLSGNIPPRAIMAHTAGGALLSNEKDVAQQETTALPPLMLPEHDRGIYQVLHDIVLEETYLYCSLPYLDQLRTSSSLSKQVDRLAIAMRLLSTEPSPLQSRVKQSEMEEETRASSVSHITAKTIRRELLKFFTDEFIRPEPESMIAGPPSSLSCLSSSLATAVTARQQLLTYMTPEWPFLPFIYYYEQLSKMTPLPPGAEFEEEPEQIILTSLELVQSALAFLYSLELDPTSYIHQNINPAIKCYHVMKAFLICPTDQLFDNAVMALLQQLLVLFLTSSASASSRRMTNGFLDFEQHIGESFYNFFVRLLDQFQSVSFGHKVFAQYLFLFLQTRYRVEYRRTLWNQLNDSLYLLSLPEYPHNGIADEENEEDGKEGQLLPSFETYLLPKEQDRDMLAIYESALVGGKIRPSRCKHLYWIAVHHLAAFIFDDEDTDLQNEEEEEEQKEAGAKQVWWRTEMLHRIIEEAEDKYLYSDLCGYRITQIFGDNKEPPSHHLQRWCVPAARWQWMQQHVLGAGPSSSTSAASQRIAEDWLVA